MTAIIWLYSFVCSKFLVVPFLWQVLEEAFVHF